jgi:Na+-driven multidrug efflux pump
MAQPSWIEKLKARWQLKSAWQVIIILIVFACTGFTVLFIKEPILNWLAGDQGKTTLATVLYYVFILPLYNVILLAYGFIFGQFNFFWNFEKRFFGRIASALGRKSK